MHHRWLLTLTFRKMSIYNLAPGKNFFANQLSGAGALVLFVPSHLNYMRSCHQRAKIRQACSDENESFFGHTIMRWEGLAQKCKKEQYRKLWTWLGSWRWLTVNLLLCIPGAHYNWPKVFRVHCKKICKEILDQGLLWLCKDARRRWHVPWNNLCTHFPPSVCTV